ncbi:MAG: hypothetical protein IT430_04690 [Phycisphaerales bacterium]|nr:hypothetical protein [Phycisphaerales bacterium]
MRSAPLIVACLAGLCISPLRLALAQEPAEPAGPAWTDEVIAFKAADGADLEAKLSLPKRDGRAPVVFYLHGAGPRTYDNPFGYRDEAGQVQVGRYLDFFAEQLAQRGVAFFRMSKRGCKAVGPPQWMQIEREVFSKATMSVLLDDYAAALRLLAQRDDIDASRIVLMGSSEGTRLGPLLARREPQGVVGVVMLGYAADNARDTVVWQSSIGPWRNVQNLIAAARDGELSRAEYDEAIAANASLARILPFDPLDADQSGQLTAEDLELINRPRLQILLKAVEDRNDDVLWTQLMNLSSAYLLEWWDADPNWKNLQPLDVPLHIFHGTLDGTCRVEGVHEAEQALRDADRENLTLHIYEGENHDLGWSWRNAREGGPAAFRDAFDLVVSLVKVQP